MKIRGVEVADPKFGGIEITEEPIWASNSGRSITGKMIGDIVTWVTSITVSWPNLSFGEAKTIRDAIIGSEGDGSPFFDLEYNDLDKDSCVTKKVYVSSMPRTLESLVCGTGQLSGVAITFVEQGGE